MTLVVLALDAMDAALVDRFNTEPFQLNNYCEIETFNYMRDQPYTLEVWPTVATGMEPEGHGITESGTSEWDNPLLNFASRFTGSLTEGTRDRLGDLVTEYTGEQYTIAETDAETVFNAPGRVVHNWPGVANNRYLLDVWRTMKPQDDGQSIDEFERKVYGTAAEQFGWVNEMLNHNVSLIGTHVHTLDVCGHAYATDEPRLEKVYTRIGEMVENVQSNLGPDDELLLLSDHGMNVEWLDGDDAGSHSWRSMAATTADDELFDDVYGARDWIETHTPEWKPVEDEDVDLPEEQLRNLGYI